MTGRTALLSSVVLAAGAVTATAMFVGGQSTEPRGSAAVAGITDAAEQQLAGGAALELVRVDPASLGYTVVFAAGRPGVRADLDRSSKTIRVYLRRGDTRAIVAHDIAHELGHAYDAERMTDASRRAYLDRRGVPAAAWTATDASDYAVGAGDFAEVYALCHAASPDFRSTLAPRPERACELLPQEAR